MAFFNLKEENGNYRLDICHEAVDKFNSLLNRKNDPYAINILKGIVDAQNDFWTKSF